jgi:hypothetical protein
MSSVSYHWLLELPRDSIELGLHREPLTDLCELSSLARVMQGVDNGLAQEEEHTLGCFSCRPCNHADGLPDRTMDRRVERLWAVRGPMTDGIVRARRPCAWQT